jgi:hypothetical protein
MDICRQPTVHLSLFQKEFQFKKKGFISRKHGITRNEWEKQEMGGENRGLF